MARRALLCGCNYPGTEYELNGCVNDVWNYKSMLETYFGFDPANITILIDTDPGYPKPTGQNIKEKLKDLVAESVDGDVLVFHFSGHGTQVPDDGEEADGLDEALVPTDYNLICDDDLRELFSPLQDRPGVKFTMIADCCHSGSMLDHDEVAIEGAKSAGSGGLFGFGKRGIPGQVDSADGTQKRSISPAAVAKQIAIQVGHEVKPGHIRESIVEAYGDAASKKATHYVQAHDEALKALQADDRAEDNQVDTGCWSWFCGPSPTVNHTRAFNANLPKAGTKPPPEQRLNDDVGILITGCQAHQESADAMPDNDPSRATGAMSNALLSVVKQYFDSGSTDILTYRMLVMQLRAQLARDGYPQNPSLECSKKNADSQFILI